MIENNTYGLRQRIGLFSGLAIFILMLILPAPAGLAAIAWKVAAVTVLMALWWLTEAIPIPATALLPLALFPTLGIMPAADASAPYGHHLIYLFLGGFFIAVTMEKWQLHRRLALLTIRRSGTGPAKIILGFMLATAALSMWISNTATAMMMVPIGLAVIKQTDELVLKAGLDNGKNFATALMLSIAYSASIGGAATIIGSPPNTILVAYVEQAYGIKISFMDWMAVALPLAMVMLLLTWLYLTRIAYPFKIKEIPGGQELIQQELGEIGACSKAEKMILVVFGLVASAWILRGFVDIKALQEVRDSTIAIIGALLLFIIPVNWKKGEFLLDWKSAVKVPWDVIILFGGGLSLAAGIQKSGLAEWIGKQLIVVDQLPLFFMLLLVVLLTTFLTELTSNTATATMLIPILGALALSLNLHPFALIIGAGLAASYAFMLPVATPPNAVVFGSKRVTIPQMARTGLWLNLLASLLITLLVIYLLPILWNIDLRALPLELGK